MGGGNASPSAADVKAIISSVGIDAEDDKLAKVIEELKGKNVEELMAEGRKRRRRKSLRRKMTTWDSDFSTKPLGSSQPCICISFFAFRFVSQGYQKYVKIHLF